MAKPKVPLDASMSPDIRAFLESLQQQADTSSSEIIPLTTQTEFISGIVAIPTAKDYRIIESIPYAATLTGFTGKTSSGSLTATLKINTTAVTTGALSVSSAQSTVTPTALNAMVASDALVITASSVSSALDFSFAVKYTRELDA